MCWICELYCSLRQCQILNTLSEARNWTCNLMVPSRIHFCCTTMGTPRLNTLDHQLLLYWDTALSKNPCHRGWPWLFREIVRHDCIWCLSNWSNLKRSFIDSPASGRTYLKVTAHKLLMHPSGALIFPPGKNSVLMLLMKTAMMLLLL